METQERIKGTVSISELFEYMRKEDLVITKRVNAERNNLKDRMLRRKWLKIGDILKAGLWGDIGRDQITTIAKRDTGRGELRTNMNGKKEYFEISIAAVKRIGESRKTI